MTKTELLNALARHQGREKGISAQRLAALLAVPQRRLRKLVSELREEGIAICGTPATGYYMAVTPEELQETCSFLEHRALHSLRRLSQMKKVSLPTLLGQLMLNQA
jgi:biotin operon repressor